MKASKANKHVEEIEMRAIESDIEQYPDSINIPPEVETDTVSALLRRIADRGNHEAASFAYHGPGADDYIDEQALHRIVEDLQFGHDLRL